MRAQKLQGCGFDSRLGICDWHSGLSVRLGELDQPIRAKCGMTAAHLSLMER